MLGGKVLLLKDRKLNTLTLGEGDGGLRSISDNKHVGKTSGELVSSTVLNVSNIEGSRVSLTRHNGTNTALVTTLGDHDKVSDVEGNVSSYLSSLDRNTNSVVLFNHRIGESNGSSVVGYKSRNLLIGDGNTLDTAQFVLLLSLLLETVKSKSSLDIEKKTERILALLDGHNIYIEIDHLSYEYETSSFLREKGSIIYYAKKHIFKEIKHLPMKPAG
jgi:hypothetical protein